MAAATAPQVQRTDFEMYSDKGDKAVWTMVQGVVDDLVSGKVTRPDLYDVVQQRKKAVAMAGFGEVWDTEPQWAVADALNEVLPGLGYRPISRWSNYAEDEDF